MVLRSGVREFDDYWQWYEMACAAGWSDGLPLAPPTKGTVVRIIEYLDRNPQDMIGVIPPRMGVATVEQIAIQAAMAGCLPEHVPVVIAAIEATMDPRFNLKGVQATANACAPLVIVGGPVVAQLRFNAKEGCFGGGSRANAAVGRAVRLILWNIGGALPGGTDMATLGMPGKFSFCVAENHEESPWQPLHADHGLRPEQSAVTVFACTSPEHILVVGEAERILKVLATTLPTTGINMFHAAGQFLVVITPKPARELARAGYSKDDVRRWIFENARYDLGMLRRWDLMVEDQTLAYYWGHVEDAPKLPQLPDEERLPMVLSPEDIHLLVAGGLSQWWAALCPGWGNYGGYAVTRPIVWPSGRQPRATS